MANYTSLELSWTPPAMSNRPLRGTKVYYSPDPELPIGEWTEMDIPGDATSATISGLEPNTPYYVKASPNDFGPPAATE